MRSNRINIVVTFLLLSSSLSFAQMAATSGAFSRMGFGARGMGMGNAMTAVRSGENSGFYNPAAVAHLKERHISLAYGSLSLDRSLNSIFYSQPLDSNAGISFGILNAGVSYIDGRDNDGFKTETYSVSENQFFLSFALKIRKLTIGITSKLFYYSLFEKLSSTALGFDAGIMLPLSDRLTLAAAVKDLNAHYRWETADLYGQYGNSTISKFPTRRSAGLSYRFESFGGLVSAEYERSNKRTSIIRLGGEVTPMEMLTLRAGIDGWNVNASDEAHPSFGLTLRTEYDDWKPSLNYAYILEPYGLFAIHVISLSVTL